MQQGSPKTEVKRDVKLEGKNLENALEEVTQGGYKQENIKGGLLGEIAPEPPEEGSLRQQFRHLPTYERLRRMREEQECKKKEMCEQHEAKGQGQQTMKQQSQMQPTHQMQPTQAQKIQYQQPKTHQPKPQKPKTQQLNGQYPKTQQLKKVLSS